MFPVEFAMSGKSCFTKTRNWAIIVCPNPIGEDDEMA